MMINVTKIKQLLQELQLNRAQQPLRILVVAEAVALAHMARATVLTQWALEAGHEVQLAAGPKYQNVAHERGITPISLETITPERFASRLARGQFFYNAKELESYVGQERALIRAFKPDVIVSEFRLTMAISAQLETCPLLSLANAYWSPAGSYELPPPSGGLLGVLPYAIRAAVFKHLQPLALKAFCAPLNRLRRRHDLPQLSDFRAHYTAGQACGYCDVPEMLPLTSMPENHFYLGPIPWQPQDPPPAALADLDQKRPLIYVTLGSTGDEKLTRDLIPPLLRRGCNLVVSGLDPQAQPKMDESDTTSRLLMAKCFDPRPVLRKAALTICHGGSGTIYQSLSQGVPLLCLPHNPDQGMASASVESSGCGRTLRPDHRCVNDVVTQAVKLLDDPKPGIQALRMRECLKACDTKSLFLHSLNELAPKNKVRSSRHELHNMAHT